MVTSETIVAVLLEDVLQPKESPALLQSYVDKLTAIAKTSRTVGSYVRRANPLLAKLRTQYTVLDNDYEGEYDAEQDYIWLDYPKSLKAAAAEFQQHMEHELVHRAQYKRAKRRKHFYPPAHQGSTKDYAGRTHEMMANAHEWVKQQVRNGLTKEEIMAKLKQPKEQVHKSFKAGDESVFRTWYTLFKNGQPRLNRFFKYAYQYAQQLPEQPS